MVPRQKWFEHVMAAGSCIHGLDFCIYATCQLGAEKQSKREASEVYGVSPTPH